MSADASLGNNGDSTCVNAPNVALILRRTIFAPDAGDVVLIQYGAVVAGKLGHTCWITTAVPVVVPICTHTPPVFVQYVNVPDDV